MVIINAFLKLQKKRDYWERYKILVAIIITILLCAIIYLIGNDAKAAKSYCVQECPALRGKLCK